MQGRVSRLWINTFNRSLTKVYAHPRDALSTNRSRETVWGIYEKNYIHGGNAIVTGQARWSRTCSKTSGPNYMALFPPNLKTGKRTNKYTWNGLWIDDMWLVCWVIVLSPHCSLLYMYNLIRVWVTNFISSNVTVTCLKLNIYYLQWMFCSIPQVGQSCKKEKEILFHLFDY